MAQSKIGDVLRIVRENALVVFSGAFTVILLSGFVSVFRGSRDYYQVALQKQLTDPDPKVRSHAINALSGHRMTGSEFSLVTGALKDQDPSVRRSAALAMGASHNVQVVAPLSVGPDITSSILAALTDADKDVRDGAAQGLGYVGTPAVEPLIATLNSSDVETRGYAAQVLGNIKDPRAVNPLISAIDSTSYAALALGEIGDRKAVPPLLGLLKDGAPDSAGDAAKALGEIGDLRAIKPLTLALGNGSPVLSEAAAWALAAMGRPGVNVLEAALEDMNPQVRRVSARVLSNKVDEQTSEAFRMALARGDVAVVAGAHQFFIRIGAGQTALIEGLNEFGDTDMALDFLNCGNPVLESAATSWASKYGYKVVRAPGAPNLKWGAR